MENPFEQIQEQLTAQNKLLLQILSKVNQDHTNADEVGGIDLAVKITGLKQSTIYQLTSRREIPHSRRLKKLYFSKKALLKWIEEAGRPTVFDYEQAAANSQKKSA